MIVILSVKVTGSAEIVVTAGSSTDSRFVIADYLGWTIAAVLQKLLARGYRLTFVTDQFFICTKNGSPSVRTTKSAFASRVKIFNRKYQAKRL